MKKYLSFLTVALLLLALALGGCAKPAPRPSVKGISPACLSSAQLMAQALEMDPERTKKDLDGKVVEIYGWAEALMWQSKEGTPRVDLLWRTIVCELKSSGDPKFKAIKDSSTSLAVRGYAEVVYDKLDERSVLILHDAEIIEEFGFTPMDMEDEPKFRQYLSGKKYDIYTAENRAVYSGAN